MRRVIRDDRGAVSVTTAVLLSLVLLAVAALAVDAGALYAEKRELQNVADSSALAIAEDCVNRPATCSQENAELKAAELAEANSSDELADVDVTLEPGRVTVVASTRNAAGTVMPSWFSGASDNGTITTRAVVTWGSLGRWSGGLPFTVDVCEWMGAVGSPSGPFPSPDTALIFHSTAYTGPSTCPASSGPHADNPGGFGLLDGAQDEECETTTTADGYAAEYNGNSLGSVFNTRNGSCADDLKAYIDTGAKVFLPLYDTADGDNGEEYHLVGYAGLVITGFNFGSNRAYPPSTSCGVSGPGSNNTFCIRGYFTDALAPAGSVSGGGDYGVTTPPALVE